jgi:hypothetical protein
MIHRFTAASLMLFALGLVLSSSNTLAAPYNGTPLCSAQPALPCVAFVTASALRVRTSSSPDSAILTAVPQGAPLVVVADTHKTFKADGKTGTWKQVLTPDGQTGFVFGGFIGPMPPDRPLPFSGPNELKRTIGETTYQHFISSSIWAFYMTDNPEKYSQEFSSVVSWYIDGTVVVFLLGSPGSMQPPARPTTIARTIMIRLDPGCTMVSDYEGPFEPYCD